MGERLIFCGRVSLSGRVFLCGRPFMAIGGRASLSAYLNPSTQCQDMTFSQVPINSQHSLPTRMSQGSFTGISVLDSSDLALYMANAMFPRSISPVPGTSSGFQVLLSSGTSLTELTSPSPASTPSTPAGLINTSKRWLSSTPNTITNQGSAWGLPPLQLAGRPTLLS